MNRELDLADPESLEGKVVNSNYPSSTIQGVPYQRMD